MGRERVSLISSSLSYFKCSIFLPILLIFNSIFGTINFIYQQILLIRAVKRAGIFKPKLLTLIIGFAQCFYYNWHSSLTIVFYFIEISVSLGKCTPPKVPMSLEMSKLENYLKASSRMIPHKSYIYELYDRKSTQERINN